MPKYHMPDIKSKNDALFPLAKYATTKTTKGSINPGKNPFLSLFIFLFPVDVIKISGFSFFSMFHGKSYLHSQEQWKHAVFPGRTDPFPQHLVQNS